jgi:RimJ/RimL family protein N-acetyltransferase
MADSKTTSLADPGTLLATTHEVDGGLRVRMRLTRPSDGLRVRGFLEGLSPETRKRRLLAPAPAIEDDAVRHFTMFDPRARMVVAATAPVDGGETIMGLADVELLHTGVAQVGVVVDDRHQQRGVGTLLAEAVAALAMKQGADRLTAEALGESTAMERLLERLGPTVRAVEDGVTMVHTRLPSRPRRAA